MSLAVALAALGAGGGSAARAQGVGAGLGTVRGHVTGPTGDPLAGASVSATRTQRGAITRADGAYQLALPEGRYELRTRLLGYAETIDSVTVRAGEVVTRDFRAERATTTLEKVAIIGTRGDARTVISAPVPIDVLSASDLQQSGRTETAQMIQAVAPSFNLPRTTVGDGTDHIRPASLRGLSPDQTLVLVNGKRRHTSALVNVNGFVGRGSQAVDLNAIPASMIDHIEILRDGAAAQYGSDAIAGVINIVLKTTAPASFTQEVGENATTYNRDATTAVAFAPQMSEVSAHDGRVSASALNYGLTFGQNGYLQLGGEIRDRQGTNRTLPDTRPQYFAGDPKNSLPAQINHWQGESYNHDSDVFFNAGTTLSSGIDVYGFGGFGHRHGAAAGFWRRPNDDRTVRAIFPDGFLPFIKSRINDGSLSAGLKGDARGWAWDLSSVYGHNSFAFSVDNSANVSIGGSSPTSFDAGTLAFGQSTTTLDLSRSVGSPWHGPIRLAFGAELRSDQYEITAGDSNSYRNGGAFVLAANGQPALDANGNPKPGAPGSQVFPGFKPSDAGSHSRTNEAAYIDLESDVTSQLLLGVAGRVEHYSDFGSTSTGKVSARYEPVKGFALRGTASTGFRAPSLGQEFFSSTATNFVNGTPFDIKTFPVATTGAQLLGATDLKPEKSVNVSGGVAMELLKRLALTVDFYHIEIKDRIVLSDNFTGATVQNIFAAGGLTGVNGGRYFTNAIDTRSNGADVVANYGYSFSPRSVLTLTAGYNRNFVKVTHVDTTPTRLASYQETLFGRVERMRIEHGNPRDNLFVSGNYTLRGLGLTARTQRYGEVSLAGVTPTNATGTLDQTYGAKWITDVGLSYSLRSRYTLSIGADNVFDVYPDRNLNPGNPTTSNGGISNFGIFPYNGISPFGFNGRFVYTKLSLSL
jgi:iron complex outermembrane receptor protein